MPSIDKAQLEQLALDEFKELGGKIVLVSEIECMDENDDLETVHFHPPVVARIVARDDAQWIADRILHWEGEFLDPAYDIEILERHPAFVGFRPTWLHGTCRSLSGDVQPAGLVVADEITQRHYADAEGLDYDGNHAPIPAQPAPGVI